MTISPPLTAFQGLVYFPAGTPENRSQLWRTDGTTAGTELVRAFDPLGLGFPVLLTAAGDRLFFFADSALWRTDGSTFVSVWNVPAAKVPSYAIAAGSLLYFGTVDGALGNELWRSDGTSEGTFQVPVAAQPAGSVIAIGETLYFFAFDSQNALALWKSDGSASGAQRVKDVPALGWGDGLMAPLGDLLLFVAGDSSGPELPYRLWRSDGTAEGTYPLHDFAGEYASVCPGTCPPPLGPTDLTALGERVLFFANDGVHGRELWTTDGTAEGTALVKDIFEGAAGGFFSGLVPAGERVYFGAQGANDSETLWVSDGSEAGTRSVASPQGTLPRQGGGIYPFAAVGDRLVLLETGTNALFSTDGTDAGLLRLYEIGLPGASSLLDVATLGDGSLLFGDWNGLTLGLLRTDGTPAGTAPVRLYDRRPEPPPPSPRAPRTISRR